MVEFYRGKFQHFTAALSNGLDVNLTVGKMHVDDEEYGKGPYAWQVEIGTDTSAYLDEGFGSNQDEVIEAAVRWLRNDDYQRDRGAVSKLLVQVLKAWSSPEAHLTGRT